MEGVVFLVLVFGAALLLLKTIGFIAHGLIFLLLLPLKILGAVFAIGVSIIATLASVGFALLIAFLSILLVPLLLLLIPVPVIVIAGLSVLGGLLPFAIFGLAVYGLVKLIQLPASRQQPLPASSQYSQTEIDLRK